MFISLSLKNNVYNKFFLSFLSGSAEINPSKQIDPALPKIRFFRVDGFFRRCFERKERKNLLFENYYILFFLNLKIIYIFMNLKRFIYYFL